MPLYFRVFLLIPLVLAIIGATVPVLRDIGIFQVAMAVMFAGGIPYLVFVVCALFWSIKQGDVDHAKAFVLAPFVFGVMCFIYGLVRAYVDLSEPSNLFVALGVASTMAVFGVIVSAVYAWGALCIWWLISTARKTG